MKQLFSLIVVGICALSSSEIVYRFDDAPEIPDGTAVLHRYLDFSTNGLFRSAINSRGVAAPSWDQSSQTEPLTFTFDVPTERVVLLSRSQASSSHTYSEAFTASGSLGVVDSAAMEWLSPGITSVNVWFDYASWDTSPEFLEEITVGAVPEPSAVAALSIGLIATMRRRKH